jgi:hypothetical protein
VNRFARALVAASVLAPLAACAGGFASPARYKSESPAMATAGGAAADAPGVPATPVAVVTGADGVAIATEEPVAQAPRPQAGQLTAGVWDDNQNFAAFAPYAERMRAANKDLAAFTAAEQEGARAQLANPRAHQQLDIQLVIDTTGSMGDELAYLQSELDSIAKQVHDRYPDLQPRWSLVLYRDKGDDYVTRKTNFTTDLAKFRAELGKQSADGGGDFPEAVIAGLDAGLSQSWRDTADVARLMFWVADAPPHPGEGDDLATLARRAARLGVHVYPIASSGIDDPTEYQMRATAQLTGGRYLFLTDDSGIGGSHDVPQIPCYSVTRLDRAVIRMIETELSGQRAPVADEDVVRRVGSPDAEGKCRIGEQMVVAF